MHLTLYLWTLGLSVLAVNLVNIFCIPSDYAVWQLLLFGILNPIAIFGIDALVATVIHKMPAKYFSPYKKAYKSHKWEKKFYKAIKIVKWKDYIPDTGKMTTGLSKSEIASTQTDYLYHFLVETCYAETIHIWMALVGIINILIMPKDLFLPMMLPFFIINFILNIPPILIQRNNRPKLLHIYEIQCRKENKNPM